MAVALVAGCARDQKGPEVTPVSAFNSAPAEEPAKRWGPFKASDQVVLVTAPRWTSTAGRLELHERTASGEFQRLDVWPVNLGSKGMGWGAGLHGMGKPQDGVGPEKVEGDKRAPAGVFRVGTLYGYDKTATTKLPYQQVDEDWKCVDDPESKHYNQVVRTSESLKDWSSAEDMKRSDERYRFTLALEHNAKNTPKKGSCIFAHVEGGTNVPTVGCTSMPLDKMKVLAGWLDPAKNPVFVVIPESERRNLEQDWQLP